MKLPFAIVYAITLASLAEAQETIPPPREAEVITVMPRDVTGQPIPQDPPSLIRGAVRNLGTYDNPYPSGPVEMTRRQVQLLQTLNKLQLFEPEDDLDTSSREWDHLRQRILGPELIPVRPRVKN